MVEHPLQSLAAYSRFVAELLDRSSMERSTVVVWSASPYTGIAEGEVYFSDGIRIRLREELDFDARVITSYGYEVYRHDERLYTTTFHIQIMRHWRRRSLITSMCLQISSTTVSLHQQ